MNLNRTVIILRSCSNAGKSTFAEYIKDNFIYRDDAIIVSADDYFTDNNGNYNFDATKLFEAHKQCQRNFIHALMTEASPVIVSNTNCKISDMEFYLSNSKEFGYSVFSIILERRHGNFNNHSVPEKTLIHQENNLRSSLKLR